VNPLALRAAVVAAILLSGSAIATAQYYERSYALVVGIDDYESRRWPRLTYARNDAEGVASLLTGQGFEVVSLYNEQATKTAIIEKLQNDFAPRLRKNDRVLFFFAGHGFTEALAGQDFGYVVPYDGKERSATYLSMEELQSQSEKMASAKHQLFILDACYGGLFGLRGVTSIDNGVPNYLQEVTRRAARQFITAGGKDQQVLDGGPSGHSYFTHHLLDALKEGLADSNADGYITFSELDGYLKPRASNKYQTPATGALPGHGQGEFVFRSGKTEKIAADPNNVQRATTDEGSRAHGQTALSEWPGVEAELTRFENTGGMLTLEITFRNVGSDAVEIGPQETNELIDESTGRSWEARQSGGFISGGKKLNPGDTYWTWTKYLVGDPIPAQFTVVVGGVPKPFERLVLR